MTALLEFSERMTSGAPPIAAERTLIRIQEEGQVTLPADMRKRLGLKAGDLVAVEETPDGVLITPQQVLAIRDLDQIGAALREQGISLEELMESGRAIREELFREKYGNASPTKPD